MAETYSEPTPNNVSPMHEDDPLSPPVGEKHLKVVGLGASAGGLKALQTFFETVPADTGMAFVVVTHLHPERESMLDELIQARTTMPVRQVTTQVPIEPNHVYILSPNRNIILTDTHLETTAFKEPRGHRMPIDIFFRSLAEGKRDAIAIVLSGGGTDGAVGVKAVKERGGLLLVQDPGEAEFDSMPLAAIATGLADLILPVAELAERLVEYDSRETYLPQDPNALTMPELENLHRILTQVHSRTGHDFSQYKRSTILRRIQRRMQLNGYTTLDAYLTFLRHDGEEPHTLFNDLLIGVTNFFRDREAWDILAQEIVPRMFEGKDKEQAVRVWTIGCSTGEEAYSVAMVLVEHAESLEVRPPIQVFASDLDEGALNKAREGIYPEAIEADVSQERLKRFFVKEGSYYRVRRELRDLVLFADHSVLRDPPFSRLDLLSCRNLLIYLQRDLQENVFEIFHYALNPEGYLFLGSSESAETMYELFRTVNKTHRIYQARPWLGEHASVPMMPLQSRRLNAPRRRPWLHIGDSTKETVTAMAGMHQRSLEQYGPPSILVDEAYHVLHLSETVGRFLLPPGGPMTTDLLKLVRPELQLELRTALFTAFESGRAVVTAPISVQFNGHPHRVVMAVRPRLHGSESYDDGMRERLALVIFLEDEFDEGVHPGLAEGEEGKTKGRHPANDRVVVRLENEMQRLREQLQAHVEEYESSTEELKAANEELQSINEEYRSTTEELETSKEELQSVNEELQTVNSELKSKLEEISRAHSDLENLLAATEIATLFLDRELRIKRYTPGMEAVFNIMPTDRGRPIAHLTNKLAYDNLEGDANQVLKRLVPIEREIKGPDNNWFLVRMRPYRTIDDRIDGIVITFINITRLKTTEVELRERENALQIAREYSEKIVDTVREGLLVLADDLTVQFANNSFYTIFQVKPENTIGAKVYDLGNGQWNIPPLRKLLEEVLPQNDVFNDFEVSHAFEDIGQRTMLLNGRRLDHVQLILLAIDDITAQRTAINSLQKREQELHQLNETLEKKVEARTQILHELAAQMTRAEQEERQRISQILHDELQQRLYTVQVQLQFLRDSITTSENQAVLEEVNEMEKWLTDAIETTRSLSIDLSPPILRDEGLLQALHWLAAQMRTQYGMEIIVQADARDQTFAILDKNLHVLLFQLVRELLFNIVKHAQVSRARVALSHVDHTIRIEVSDEGTGFDPETILTERGQGLRNIRHRLHLVGGEMQIESTPGIGTRVTMLAPLPHQS